jgi:hypothetical protein
MNHALATTGAEGVEIFMSAPLVTARLQRGTLGDLAAMWVALFAALAYLDVPLRNAPLFAIALVLQAALGTLVITSLLDGLQPSLLLLCGPGLILGGALSFAVFQIVGRGMVGLSVSLTSGVFACAGLINKSVVRESGMQSALLWLQLCGLAALAMSSEFEWLLNVAGGCLAASLAWFAFASRPPVAMSIAAISFIGTVGVATVFRGPFWWAVSDDYMLFEVIARHITAAGPFTPWGVVDFSRYHWLSYGWSGLLDFAASSPDTLVTLTRVIPLVYSLALASSLLVVVERVLRPRLITPVTVLPAWAIVASVRLDWAAPSTAGIFAVITATVAIAAIIVDRDDAPWRRLSLYALFASVAVLTKLPGSLVLLPLVLAAETLSRGARSQLRRTIHAVLAALAGFAFILALLPTLSHVLDGFTIEAKRLPGLSWFYGPYVAAGVVIVRVLWILFPLLAVWSVVFRLDRRTAHSDATTLGVVLSLFLAMGVTAESLVNGPQNTQQYFSAPNYFVATLALLVIAPHLSGQMLGHRRPRIALWWSVVAIVLVVWNFAASRLTWSAPLDRAAIRDTISDPRLIFAAVLTVAIWMGGRTVIHSLAPPLLLLLFLLVQQGVKPTTSQIANDGIRPTVKPAELVAMLGTDDAQAAGRWLRENTQTGELLATNYLRVRSTNEFSDDYSLAMWSQRTFLVIGPKFFYASDSAKSEIDVSLRFGAEPDAASASQLFELGVDWFVVDREATSVRSWKPWAELRFESGRFAVLRLKTSATS